ncbi:MAG: Nif3-like dinuclear metal center hexameric protein [Azonexus sp.]|jgi:dinuclear metal center YbgI/SA1388 family protein|nr:Nif3-like dinuclear metal center hexameric protein [Betaproteobacteria bacterium]MBK8916988.1 Nif3-like dinuclear metal center hexameric protein [Betaproteobacteria bacterium]MBP6036055.1 Nif3-like dinuclear metal center hexameric protein [Azonexus sp.]MBP6906578.1 Nif3-like dinuclear metal center hexameric protein [Azonexus sp.]
MKREELVEYLDRVLDCGRFRDYCPNGLQVEGRADVRCIVAGVTASQALLDAAVTAGADAVLVHHGYFWRGEDGRVTGMRRRRLATLLSADINLLAYHLPLDAHAEFGNNVQLARLAGWQPEGRFGDQDLGCLGRPAGTPVAADLAADLGGALGRDALLVGDGKRPVRRMAWCTGAAQGYFEAAIALGADVFVSGEISEQTVHLARESGVPYVACGHHASERYGVRALADHLAQTFALDCRFVDIDNPV